LQTVFQKNINDSVDIISVIAFYKKIKNDNVLKLLI